MAGPILQRPADLGVQQRLMPTRPQDYVQRFCSELKLSGEVQSKAAEILKDAAKKELTSGRGPTGVAAAADDCLTCHRLKTPAAVRQWEEIKRDEKNAGTTLGHRPPGLPALTTAYRIQEKAAAVRFEWVDFRGALEKLREEIDELEEALDESADAVSALGLAAVATSLAEVCSAVASPGNEKIGKPFTQRSIPLVHVFGEGLLRRSMDRHQASFEEFAAANVEQALLQIDVHFF